MWQSTQQMSFDTVRGPTFPAYEDYEEYEETNHKKKLRSSYNKPINEVESMNYVEKASTLIETVFHSIQMQEKVDPKLQDKINKQLSKQLSKLLVCAGFRPHPHAHLAHFGSVKHKHLHGK